MERRLNTGKLHILVKEEIKEVVQKFGKFTRRVKDKKKEIN